jgi:hypothetical protein
MSGRIFMRAFLVLILFFTTSNTALAGDISLSGDVDISGDVNITEADKGISYPNGTRQTGWYARTVIVSPLGSPTENGTRLMDAMAGITAAGSTNPFLIKLEPGVYDIGANTLTVKDYVQMEGSGEGITTVRGNPVSSFQGSPNGVVACGNYTELRWLTVENYGGSGDAFAVSMYQASIVSLMGVTAKSTAAAHAAVAIYINNSGPDFFRVNAQASGGGSLSAGLYAVSSGFSATLCRIGAYPLQGSTGDSYGVYSDNIAQLNSCTIGAGNGGRDSYGIKNGGTSSLLSMEGGLVSGRNGSRWNHAIQSHGTMHLRGVEIIAEGGTESYGIHNASDASSANFEGGKIWGATKGVRNDASLGAVYVTTSKLYNGVQISPGALGITCAGVYDGAFIFYTNTCP